MNEKIEKLSKALRIRLIEIEVEDQNVVIYDVDDKDSSMPQSLSDMYSTIYAYTQKIL